MRKQRTRACRVNPGSRDKLTSSADAVPSRASSGQDAQPRYATVCPAAGLRPDILDWLSRCLCQRVLAEPHADLGAEPVRRDRFCQIVVHARFDALLTVALERVRGDP